MSEPIPVNPEMLRWARETLHLSIEEVAQHMNKNVETIVAWESGSAFPTYVQLETLACKVYNRPLALFFFPNPPEEESVERSFRTLPEHALERIPSRVCFLLRKAKVLQMNLVELYEGVNPADRKVLNDLNFRSSDSAVDMAERIRAYLGISLDQQQSWESSDDALKYWRNALEGCGVFVFKDTFNHPGKKRVAVIDSSFSGFCLFDTEFPVIYVNNNKPKTRQIFTLFHELAHLLMKTGGVDTSKEDYIDQLSGESRLIEELCNQFSAEFLVPSRDFEARSAKISISDRIISEWADLYCVSRETILRRLLEQETVDHQYYEEKVKEWYKVIQEGGTGGNYYLTKGAYLGERYIETVFSRYHQGHISMEEVADYLGAKTKNVSGMEEWLFKHGATT